MPKKKKKKMHIKMTKAIVLLGVQEIASTAKDKITINFLYNPCNNMH